MYNPYLDSVFFFWSQHKIRIHRQIDNYRAFFTIISLNIYNIQLKKNFTYHCKSLICLWRRAKYNQTKRKIQFYLQFTFFTHIFFLLLWHLAYLKREKKKKVREGEYSTVCEKRLKHSTYIEKEIYIYYYLICACLRFKSTLYEKK